MSQRSSISCFVASTRLFDRKELLAASKCLGASDVFAASRTFSIDNEWRLFQEPDECDVPDMESVATNGGIVEILLRYTPPGLLLIDISKCAALTTVLDVAESALPAECRGVWMPQECFLLYGEHDVFDTAAPRFVMRSTFEVRFSGYGTPTHAQNFRHFVLSDDRIASIACALADALKCPVHVDVLIML